MSIHNRGLDGKRPVHPMCEAHNTGQCTCDWLWMGMESEDFAPMAEVERKRRLSRNGTFLPGAHADKDEFDSTARKRGPLSTEDNVPYDSEYQGTQKSTLELAGFWDRAEEYEIRPVWNVEPDRIAAFNDIQAKWGSEFAHAWLSKVAHDYRLTRTHEQFCWLKSRDYL